MLHLLVLIQVFCSYESLRTCIVQWHTSNKGHLSSYWLSIRSRMCIVHAHIHDPSLARPSTTGSKVQPHFIRVFMPDHSFSYTRKEKGAVLYHTAYSTSLFSFLVLIIMATETKRCFTAKISWSYSGSFEKQRLVLHMLWWAKWMCLVYRGLFSKLFIHYSFHPTGCSTCRKLFRLQTAHNSFPDITVAVITCWGHFDNNFVFPVHWRHLFSFSGSADELCHSFF